MATSSFALPIDVPWQLVAASPDMMDTTFCDDTAYPPAWQSSLAIYAYGPSPDNLPAELCNQTITYLKVTCSITGYQPTQAETSAGNFGTPPYANPNPIAVAIPNATQGVGVQDVPDADIFGDFVDAYFACYGVLLNVSVFPSATTLPQATPIYLETYTFGSGSYPTNPFVAIADGLTAPDGLIFSLIGPDGHAPFSVVQIGADYAIQIPSGTILEIDLPLSSSVALQVFGSTGESNAGTITGYDFETQVFQTSLAGATPNVFNNVPLGGVQVTKIIVSSVDDDTYLSSITYSNLEWPTTLADYPHIIDFEPKTRDLYQSATDYGEVLTGSNSNIGLGKSQQNAQSSGMGITQSTGVNSMYGSGSTALTGSWGQTTNDSSNTQIDASRQSRETQSATTIITQQYNLLTGYHAGTNRAAFLMLPRPHTLQPTDFRTFVRGLRMIEGIQEFILIVSSPKALPGICIEATLETGHFPEDVTTAPPRTVPGPTTTFTSPVSARSAGQFSTSPSPTAFGIPISSPWILDTTQMTPPATAAAKLPTNAQLAWTFLVPGVFYTYAPVAGQTTSSIPYQQATAAGNFSIQITSESSTSVSGDVWLTAHGASTNAVWNEQDADLEVTFLLCLTQPPQNVPPPVDSEPVVVSPFLVTSRDLCACISACPSNNCVMVGPTQQVNYSRTPGATDPAMANTSSGSSKAQSGTANTPGGLTASVASNAISAKTASKTKRAQLRSARLNAAKNAPRSPNSGAVNVGASPTATKVAEKHLSDARSSIVYETKLKLPRGLMLPTQLQISRTPAARELMYKIQHHMLNNWRMPERRPHGAVGFLESDYLTERLRSRLPKAYLDAHISAVEGIPQTLIKKLGHKKIVGDILKLNLHQLRLVGNLNLDEAVQVRRLLMGFERTSDSTPSEPAKPVSGLRSPKGVASVKNVKSASFAKVTAKAKDVAAKKKSARATKR